MIDNQLIFRSFASGSSGNCYFLGTSKWGILIDAGISARTIQKNLREMGLDYANIMGVLITHDHADHIRAVGTLGERVHLPIYSTRTIHDGIDRNYGVREKLRTSQRYIEKGEKWELNGMIINTFGISHDSSECIGYVIDFLGQRFVIATDCGQPNLTMELYLNSANHIVIEANHDESLLLNGPYPTFLKERILSPKGHQSNVTCGKLLAKNWHANMRNIFLCHLSHENNDPTIALETIKELLLAEGIMPGEDLFITPLDRQKPSPVYVLNDNIITQKPS
ncbi:MAG: MBL fold metallo-hydrolase [Paludibacteraceae bacterium]|jgi:phosphoribosyl 1,2-cyclic phosphodiesterase|nr:MBL fold metallo-hydrolase [Paludibacteraceae bacterium]